MHDATPAGAVAEQLAAASPPSIRNSFPPPCARNAATLPWMWSGYALPRGGRIMSRQRLRPATMTGRALRSAMRACWAPAAPRSSTAPPPMARTSTTRSRAGRCMRAPSSCRPCSRPASATARTAASVLFGIAIGVETMCRLGLVTPKLMHKAGFHPTAVFGAMAAAAGVAAALGLDRARHRQCARHRRQHGVRHHRISRRGRLDQAHACRLGGAIGLARRADGAARFPRPAHRVRGNPRPVPWLRPYHPGRLRRADRRFRHAAGSPRRSPSSPIRAGP